jgi:hypothetical protein
LKCSQAASDQDSVHSLNDTKGSFSCKHFLCVIDHEFQLLCSDWLACPFFCLQTNAKVFAHSCGPAVAICCGGCCKESPKKRVLFFCWAGCYDLHAAAYFQSSDRVLPKTNVLTAKKL